MLHLLFWSSLLFWSLFPSTKTVWFEIASIPINSKHIVLIVLSCLYLLSLPLKLNDKRSVKTSLKSTHTTSIFLPWHRHLPIITISLLLYASVSINNRFMDVRDAKAMIYTLILTASSFFLAYSLILKQRSIVRVRMFLSQFTFCLAVIGCIYTIASLFSITIGDARSSYIDNASAFGMIRAQGPLFGSDDGYFVLIPALAFSIQDAIQTSRKRLLKFLISFSLILTLVASGSRGGLLILIIFLGLIILFIENKKLAGIITVSGTVLITIAVTIVFSKANPERLFSLTDSTRMNTYLTSFNIVKSRDLESNILGSGYGSQWAWYLPDIENGSDLEKEGRRFKVLFTTFGAMLYHPHSTFLIFIVELGMLGLFYFLFLWIILARLFWNRKNLTWQIFNCGMFVSGLAMFFNFFLFRLPTLSCMWWIYLFGALALNSCEIKDKHSIQNRHEVKASSNFAHKRLQSFLLPDKFCK